MEKLEMKIESLKAEKRLYPEEMENISKAWAEMVIGKEDKNTESALSDEKFLKERLSQSLQKETSELLEEWEIIPDRILIEKIESSQDANERAVFELEYIKGCFGMVGKFVEGFSSDNERKNTRWNTMPVLMRKNRSFNCVGAALIGESLLSRAGIENYYGMPSGHAVSIARLANGDWWYVDFRNCNKVNCRKIDPKEETIEGAKTLRIDDKVLEYKFIILGKIQDIPSSIFQNLEALKDSAAVDNQADQGKDQKIAKDFFNQFKDWYGKIDFGDFSEALYPEISAARDSHEMESERERIEVTRKAGRNVADFFNKLELEKRKELIVEAKSKLDKIEKFFFTKNEKNLNGMSEELKTLLLLQEQGITDFEGEHPFIRKEIEERSLAILDEIQT